MIVEKKESSDSASSTSSSDAEAGIHSFVNRVRRQSVAVLKHIQEVSKPDEDDISLEDTEVQRIKVASFQQTSLDSICDETHLSRLEVRRLYRSFKETFPDGVVRQDEMHRVISSLFPYGDAKPYADLLFNAIGSDKFSVITFRELASAVAVLNNGSVKEKLRWSFRIFDKDNDEFITRSELTMVLQAVYGLIGTRAFPAVTGQTIRDHATRLFEKLDKNRDGIIDVDEFLESCESDEMLNENLVILTGTKSAKKLPDTDCIL